MTPEFSKSKRDEGLGIFSFLTSSYLDEIRKPVAFHSTTKLKPQLSNKNVPEGSI